MNATTHSLQNLITATVFAGLAVGLIAASHAGETVQDRMQVIEYSAADASTLQGAGKLYQRIGQAAQEVCSVLDHGYLASKWNYRSCVQRVTEAAVVKVNRPALDAVYQSNHPSSLRVELATALNR